MWGLPRPCHDLCLYVTITPSPLSSPCFSHQSSVSLIIYCTRNTLLLPERFHSFFRVKASLSRGEVFPDIPSTQTSSWPPPAVLSFKTLACPGLLDTSRGDSTVPLARPHLPRRQGLNLTRFISRHSSPRCGFAAREIWALTRLCYLEAGWPGDSLLNFSELPFPSAVEIWVTFLTLPLQPIYSPPCKQNDLPTVQICSGPVLA